MASWSDEFEPGNPDYDALVAGYGTTPDGEQFRARLAALGDEGSRELRTWIDVRRAEQ